MRAVVSCRDELKSRAIGCRSPCPEAMARRTEASVSLHANPPEGVRFEPSVFDLAPGQEQTAQVFWQPHAGQAEQLQDWLQSGRRNSAPRPSSASPGEYLLEWRLDGEREGFIP